jgi:hypothetical protein
VAFETEHGKGRRRQPLEGNELGRIAATVLADEIRVYGLAAGTVAGLTVNEGHFRPFYFLVAVDTFHQELGRLIVVVARFEAGLVADIISEKRTDQHPFIFPHGNHGTTGLHGCAGNDQSDCRKDDSESGSLTQYTQHQPRHGPITPFLMMYRNKKKKAGQEK